MSSTYFTDSVSDLCQGIVDKADTYEKRIKYLEEEKIAYKVISDEIIDIYERINVSDLVIALSKKNCIVNSFKEKDETLENYFLNLVGGADNV